MTGEESRFRQSKQKKSASPLEQKLSHCGVLGQTNRAVEGIQGFRSFPEPLQKVSANRPVGLIGGDIVRVDPLQRYQPGFGSLRFGYGRGVSSSRAERRGYSDQLFIEHDDRVPLNSAAPRPLRRYRLSRRFKLKPAGGTATRRFAEMPFRLFNQGQRPVPANLLRERHVLAVRPPPRCPTGFAVEHQSQQTVDLCFFGHQLQKNQGE